MLGEGGSGETWLCRDKQSGEELAIKFIQRPIPKVVLPMIFHEVKVRSCRCVCACVCVCMCVRAHAVTHADAGIPGEGHVNPPKHTHVRACTHTHTCIMYASSTCTQPHTHTLHLLAPLPHIPRLQIQAPLHTHAHTQHGGTHTYT